MKNCTNIAATGVCIEVSNTNECFYDCVCSVLVSTAQINMLH